MEIIDVHAHFGVWNFPIPGCGTVDNLLRLCDRFNIRWALASSTEALTYDMQRGNAVIADAFTDTDRLLAYVYCNPNFPELSCQEMDAYLPLDHVVGVKLHPGYAGVPLSSDRWVPLLDEIARRTGLVKIHTFSAADAQAMSAIADRYPHVNFIMGHACAGDSAHAAVAARVHPNLYLDFCCSHALRGRVETALETCGAGQIVFGSDMDLLDPAFTMGMFEDADLSEVQRRAIFWGNAARLLGLEGA